MVFWSDLVSESDQEKQRLLWTDVLLHACVCDGLQPSGSQGSAGVQFLARLTEKGFVCGGEEKHYSHIHRRLATTKHRLAGTSVAAAAAKSVLCSKHESSENRLKRWCADPDGTSLCSGTARKHDSWEVLVFYSVSSKPHSDRSRETGGFNEMFLVCMRVNAWGLMHLMSAFKRNLTKVILCP